MNQNKRTEMQCHYSNEYGQLTVEKISEIMPIKQISRELPSFPSTDIAFDIKTAERIALITENRGVQICFFKETNNHRAYLIASDTTGKNACYVRISSLNYSSREEARNNLDKPLLTNRQY